MPMLRRLVLRGALLLCALLAVPVAAEGATLAEAGQWGPLRDFGVPAIHAALLHTGKVLLWSSGPNAAVWDPVTGEMVQTPTVFADDNIHCAGLVVLQDGRVLTVGGEKIKTVATFDPDRLTWTKAPDMRLPRWYPTLTALADGRVLVTGGTNGGQDNTGEYITEVEIFDPAANTWSVLTGADRRQDLYAPNFLLPDGRIFQPAPWQSAVLDLNTRTWTDGPHNGWRTSGVTESDAMYEPGKVIRSGGTTYINGVPQASARTGIVDMTAATPRWEEPAPMAYPRRRHQMVVLADGSVMALGGSSLLDSEPGGEVLQTEIWNPATKTWTTTASMASGRLYHSTALLLPSGQVLVAGGEKKDVGVDAAQSAQVYSPPYLFKGPRPVITAVPGRVTYGSGFSISTPDAASITSVALIRPGAVTHSNNMDQRYVPLASNPGAGGLTVTAPANGNWAPPGWYMLVVKNGNGVPSTAAWVWVGAGSTTPTPPPPAPTTPPAPAPTPPAPAPRPPAPPSTRNPQPASGSVTGAATGAATGDTVTPGAAASTPSPTDVRTGGITGVFARKTLRLADARRRGVPVSVVLGPWDDSLPRTVRVRLQRVVNGWPEGEAGRVVRTLDEPQSVLRVRLVGTRGAKALQAGTYEISAIFGTGRDAVRRATKRAIAIRR
jgi:hypothetical protein